MARYCDEGLQIRAQASQAPPDDLVGQVAKLTNALNTASAGTLSLSMFKIQGLKEVFNPFGSGLAFATRAGEEQTTEKGNEACTVEYTLPKVASSIQ
eukprot:13340-Amphidinium_carterae.1